MKKRQYSKLEGRKVTVTDTTHGTVQAKVSGADYAIGLTIQTLEGRYVVCLGGPASVLGKNLKHFDHKAHAIGMQFCYDKIMAREKLSLKALRRALEAPGHASPGIQPSSATCPFSQ